MKLTFYGAARTTTGSMHLIEANGARVLLDCGLYQGRRKKAFHRNRDLPAAITSADVCVLSHAHIDHSGNLPSLLKRGFAGRIVMTPPTRSLCEIMLADSAYLQVQDVKYVNKKRRRQGKNPFEPLYTPEDVPPVLASARVLPYGETIELAPGVALTFLDAGHLLGSAFTRLDVTENGKTRRLLFTGDMGRAAMPILKDPVVVRDVDVLITESTYGNRAHPTRQDVQQELARLCAHVLEQKSRLVIPSFSVGRTQQVLYFLNELDTQGRLDNLPVFVDSPLSSRATEIHRRHTECYDEETAALVRRGDDPFRFRNLTLVTDVEDSKRLNRMPGPVVIISASGMCEGGRILHHLKHAVGDERNVVLIVGYQAQHTLGRRIVEHVSPIRIFGEEFELRAQVCKINALSAHADCREMEAYFQQMGAAVAHAFVVHGEEEPAEAIGALLRKMGARNVRIPERGDSFEI